MTSLLFFLGAVIVAGSLIWLLARTAEQKGEAKAEAKQSGAVLDAVKDHKKVEDDVARTPIRVVRERLSKWVARR